MGLKLIILFAVITLFSTGLTFSFNEFVPTNPAHYIISDEQGNILSTVSVKVTPGDEFLTGSNDLYIITEVNQQLAHAKFVRKVYLH